MNRHWIVTAWHWVRLRISIWIVTAWHWLRLRISILRFPTLVVAALLLLAAGIHLLPAIFAGLLDIETREVAVVSWFAFLTAWVGLVTSRLTRMFAGKRFTEVKAGEVEVGPEIRWRSLALWSLAAVPLLVEVVIRPSAFSAPRWWELPSRVALALVGLALAFLTLFGVCLVQHFMGNDLTSTDKKKFEGDQMRYLLFSHKHILLEKAREFDFPDFPWAPVKRFKGVLGDGYLYQEGEERPDVLREAHVVTLGFFVLTFLVYLGGWFSVSWQWAWYYLVFFCELGVVVFAMLWWGFAWKGGPKWKVLAGLVACGSIFVGAMYLILWLSRGKPIPPLASVLLIVMLLGWGLGQLGFFFDAYRIPVLSGLAALCLLLNWGIGIQHTFSTKQRDLGEGISGPSPAEIVKKVVSHSAQPPKGGNAPPVMIAVATAGGGIQAAAWTAKVLSELSADPEIGVPFGKGLRVISAVSGGSVGTMYFVNAYHDGMPPSARPEVDRVIAQAESSSLEYVGWGLAYPDFWRTIFPPFKWLLDLRKGPTIDRGWALERAWRLQLLAGSSARNTPTMSSWERDAEAGIRPAIILNATIAEQGRPLLLATSAVPATPPVDTSRDFFKGCDLSVETAARLSATFPWVSPTAQADCRACGSPLHLADGGYFDNNGVFALIAWLRAGALQAYRVGGGTRVVFLEIRSFPDDKPPEEPQLNWIEQTIGPILLLNNVRGRGHDLQDQTAICNLAGAGIPTDLTIKRVEFVFPKGSRPPLSWHLTQRNKDDIADGWRSPSVKCSRDRLKTLLLKP